MQNAVLVGVDLGGAVLENTDLGGSIWYSMDLRTIDFSGATSTKCCITMVGAEASGTNLTAVGEAQIVFDFGRSTARNVVMTGMRIPGGAHSDFTGADLRGATIEGGWENTLLVDATLDGAVTVRALFANVDLSRASVADADFSNVTYENTTCPDGSNSNDNLGVCDV